MKSPPFPSESIPLKNTMASIQEVRAVVADYKAKLAEVEKKLAEMELASPDRPFLSNEMEDMVLVMEKRKAYKTSWKKAVSDGLLENVQRILEECYDYFLDPDSDLDSEATKAQIGELNSRQWQLFTLRVIQYLRQQGSFSREEGGFDTFEDTAGGCDEITQDAGFFLIENPDWQPK